MPNRIVAGNINIQPIIGVEKLTKRLIIGRQIIKKTYACNTDKNVPENSFAVRRYHLGRGAVSNNLITPNSLS